jgi:adenylate kinase family enzyme
MSYHHIITFIAVWVLIPHVMCCYYSIVDVATKVANYRDLSDQALVPPAMWREWMALFVQDLPLLPSSTATTGGSHDNKEEKSDGIASSSTTGAVGERELALSGGRDIENEVDEAVETIRDSSDEAAARLDARTMEEYLDGEGEWTYNTSSPLDVTATLVFDTDLPPYERKELNRGKKGDPKAKRTAAAKQASTSTAKKPVAVASPTGATSSSVSGISDSKGEGKHARQSSTISTISSSTLSASNSKRDVRTPDRSPSSAAEVRPSTHSHSNVDISRQASELSIMTSDEKRGSTPANNVNDTERKIENHIFGSLVERVFEVASGREDAEEAPDVPRLPIGICLLGKPFTGRSTQAQLLSRFHKLKIFTIDSILSEALASIADDTPNAAGRSARARAASSSVATAATTGASGATTVAPPKSPGGGKRTAKTQQQVLAAKLKKQLGRGETVTDDIYVGLVVDAIRRIKGFVKVVSDASSATTTTTVASSSGKGDAKETKETKASSVTVPSASSSDDDATTGINTDGMPSVTAIPDCGGWVLIGFPETEAQAKLLEKELSG